MQAEDGQFLEIEPGVGKLIGLMSLQALPRRITLDFRDVFSKGFQFDRITAGGAGRERRDEAEGVPHARLGGRRRDERRDRPRARDAEPARAGGAEPRRDSAALGLALVNPVAGVAAAIAQRILKNPLGQIFAFDYAVSGSWTDPKVAKILPPPPTEQITN